MSANVGAAASLIDPAAWIGKAVTSLLGHLVDSARTDIDSVLNRYLFQTVDTAVPGMRPITSNLTLQRLNFGLVLTTDALVGAVIALSSLRSIFDRTMRSHYTLKIVIPKLMVAIALSHASMMLAQLLIDLNNALGSVAMNLGNPVTTDTVPWSAPIAAPAVARLAATQDLFHALFAIVLVVAVLLLALAYVVRSALLGVLLVCAPLAALCMVLPETRGYGRTWLRLFLVTVFMQAVQLIVLRVAVATGLDHDGGLVETLYGMATLFLMLKVPGALNTASHFETKANTLGHHVGHAVHKAITPAHHAVRAHTS